MQILDNALCPEQYEQEYQQSRRQSNFHSRLQQNILAKAKKHRRKRNFAIKYSRFQPEASIFGRLGALANNRPNCICHQFRK